MALARIISSSRECARELALNLMDRGYAVEIVSPDAIPDNLADLELRVESDPGNTLAASVRARAGVRSASLEFIHHLEAPMVESNRRLLESGAPASAPAGPIGCPAVPVAGGAEPEVVANAKILQGSGEASEAVPAKPATLTIPREAAREIIAPEPPQTPPVPAERPSKFVVKVIIPRSRSASNRAPGRRGQFRRAVLTLGGALLVALALRTAAIRLGSAAAISTHKTPGVTVQADEEIQATPFSAAAVAPTRVSLAPEKAWAAAALKDPGKNAETPTPTLANPSSVLENSAGPRVEATAPLVKALAPRVKTTASHNTRPKSHHSADDLIAPDTLTFFDESARPIRVVQFPPHPAPSGKRNGSAITAKAGADGNGKTAP